MMISSHDYQEHEVELSFTPGTGHTIGGAQGQHHARPPNPPPTLTQLAGPSPSSRKKWEISSRPTVVVANTTTSLWKKIFVISCVIAVSLDPLFFYIPIIDGEKKCLGVDKKLRDISVLLRAVTDIISIVHVICEIRGRIKSVASNTKRTVPLSDVETGGGDLAWETQRGQFGQFAKEIAHKMIMSWLSLSILIDFLSLLPIPQVLLVVVFFKMRGSGYLNNRKILNFFLLVQYLPRIYRIHLSFNEFKRNTGKWVKGLFNFFLYILASHVLGAFWYFFSIQRETYCWHRACVKNIITECTSTFYCDDKKSLPKNITFLDQKCRIDVSEDSKAPFDFGIFLDSLKSGNTRSKHFPMKFFYSFWWGLRNLSNFGTNLETSDYVWENCFAILISITGLLLFLYLIGNVQTFMQLATTKSEDIRQKMKMKELDIQRWISKNGLPDDMKKEIMINIKQILEENKDADLENLFTILPWRTRKSLKRFLCMGTLRKVPMLEKMDVKVLKMICDYMKPVMYKENSYVAHMGDPLDFMLFITEGTIWTWTYTNSESVKAAGKAKMGSPTPTSMDTRQLEKGDFYGEELLRASLDKSVSKLPISTENVKCHTKVEGFCLMAKDLMSVVSKCKQYWDFNNCNNSYEIEQVARCTIGTAIRRRISCQPKKLLSTPSPARAVVANSPRPATAVVANSPRPARAGVVNSPARKITYLKLNPP